MARPKPTHVLLITAVVIVVVALGTVLAMSFQRATGPRESTDLLQANPAPAGTQ